MVAWIKLHVRELWENILGSLSEDIVEWHTYPGSGFGSAFLGSVLIKTLKNLIFKFGNPQGLVKGKWSFFWLMCITQ